MGKINWGRVVLCGFVTGVVWGALDAALLPLVGRDFITALPVGFSAPTPGAGMVWRGILFLLPLVLGFSNMWLYAAIRPRFGPGPKTALVAGFALWFFGSCVDAAWAGLGAVPPAVLVGPVATSLPITLVASLAGAWLYKE